MPDVHVVPLTAAGFERYGAVVQPPSSTPTASDAAFRYWSDLAHYGVEGETEIGWCTVYRQEPPRVTWMERHTRTPELLVPIDAPFILPVMGDGGEVEAFRVDIGEAVVIGQGVWHSACHPAEAAAASYFVVFRRGTPAEDVQKTDVAAAVLRA